MSSICPAIHISQTDIISFRGLLAYGSMAAGRDFWATNVQKVQHVGTSGDFIFQANYFLSTPTIKRRVLL